MIVNDRIRLALPLIVKLTLVSAFVGAIYGHFSAVAAGGTAFDGVLRGAGTGALIAAILTTLESLGWDASAGALARAPFLLHLVLKSLVYLLVFLFAIAAVQWLTAAPASGGVVIERSDILFCFITGFIINFLMEMNHLLGQNVLLSFVTGRYYRPRVEARVFLIIDMKNSTAAAERLGEVGFHRLLNRFANDLTGPVLLHKGQVHKYVGDELIVTWLLAEGLKDARCLRACFGAKARLAALGPSYEEEFGFRVEFRAGLHSGPVVVGEMGSVKKEIALIGDTMNTAARIVDACRDTGEAVIASATLLQQLSLPPDIAARPLGPVRLRGKQTSLALFALEAAAGAVRSPAA